MTKGVLVYDSNASHSGRKDKVLQGHIDSDMVAMDCERFTKNLPSTECPTVISYMVMGLISADGSRAAKFG